jgi:hypothetical protein
VEFGEAEAGEAAVQVVAEMVCVLATGVAEDFPGGVGTPELVEGERDPAEAVVEAGCCGGA